MQLRCFSCTCDEDAGKVYDFLWFAQLKFQQAFLKDVIVWFTDRLRLGFGFQGLHVVDFRNYLARAEFPMHWFTNFTRNGI